MRVQTVRALLLSLLVLLVWNVAGAETALISKPVVIRTGTASAHGYGGGDFNGDGLRDFVVTETRKQLVVHLGRGDGTFSPPVRTPTALHVSWPLVEDIDNDGRLDLVGETGSAIALFYGRGDGTFVEASVVPAVGEFALGDFTGDGAPDLVVTDRVPEPSRAAVKVYPNLGNGTFGAAIVTAFPTIVSLVDVAVGDFDRDGKLDIVAARPHESYVGYGTGDGRFRDFEIVPVGGGSLEVVDFNADGRPDWAAGGTAYDRDVTPERPHVIFNQADGTFVARELQLPFATAMLAALDMTGDGVPDLVTGHGGGHIGIVESRTDGTFAPPRLFAGRMCVDVGRYDGDAAPDVLIGSFDGTVALARGRGDGTLDLPRAYMTDAVPDPNRRPEQIDTAVHFADATGDARPDAITVVRTAEGFYDIVVMANDGRGAFGPPMHTRTPSGTASYSSHPDSAVADFNGDGRTDIAVGAGLTFVFNGRGDGTFDAPLVLPSSGWGVTAADVTGDGRPDLVAADSGGVFLRPNDGNGSFGSGSFFTAWTDSEGQAFADVDNDGDIDVVYASDVVFLANGRGQFHPTAKGVRKESVLGVGDFDEDGHPDLLTTSWLEEFRWGPGSYHLELHRGTGQGGFGPPIRTRIDRPLSAAVRDNVRSVVADIDGDGHLDLVNSSLGPSGYTSTITILLGDGRGGFRGGDVIRSEGSISAVALADLDGNGTLDIGVAEEESGFIDVLLTRQAPARDLPLDIDLTMSGLDTPVRHGQLRTATIQVSPTEPQVVDAIVLLEDGDRTVAIAHIGAAGKAAIRLPLGAGVHELTARHPGNGTFAAATSNALRLDVLKARLTLTIVDPSPIYIGDQRSITLSIDSPDDNALARPTGNVVIEAAGKRSVAPANDDWVSIDVGALPVGTYLITADYAGDANFAPTHLEYTLVVQLQPASIFLTVWPRGSGSVQFGAPVTLTAFIEPAGSGTVTFYDGERWLGTAPVIQGVATLTTTGLYTGTRLVRAAFSGGDTASAARSFAVQVTVIGPPIQKRRAAR